MPTKHLPSTANIDHLKYQAKDLLTAFATREPQVAQRVREFHPLLNKETDAVIFGSELRLADAQLVVAREYGFPSWVRLRKHVEKPALADKLNLPHHERIKDAAFRQAVDLLDAGDVEGLRAHLNEYPNIVHQRVSFEGGNYFRNPALLQFTAENPIRHGTLPASIVSVAKVILEAGALADQISLRRNARVGLFWPCPTRVWRATAVNRSAL